MTTLDLESEIPDEHPHKHSVEHALRDLLSGLPGSWKASISRGRVGYWWALRLEGPGLDWTLIVDPKDQNPDFIHTRIGAVLWAGGFGAPKR